MKIISFLLFLFRCCCYNVQRRQLWDDHSRQYIPLDLIHPSLELRTNAFPIDSNQIYKTKNKTFFKPSIIITM